MIRERWSVHFMGWFTVLIIIGAVAACSLTTPLPSNLDKLAISDRAVMWLGVGK